MTLTKPSFLKRTLSIVTAAVVTIVGSGLSQLAHAETFEWSINNPALGMPVLFPPYYYNNDTGGRIVSIHSSYDRVTKRLSFNTVIAPQVSGGTAPDGLTVVLTNGDMPVSVGAAAVLYLDAAGRAQPRLTAYGYNGGLRPIDNSWEDGDAVAPGAQAADRICTSADAASCGAWVRSLSVTAVAEGTRFEFEIDASAIINHAPLYTNSPTVWSGTGFGDKLGLWMRPTIGRRYGYGLSGYIAGITAELPGSVGLFRAADLDANALPECTVSAPTLTLRPRETATIVLSGFDPDGNGSLPALNLSGGPDFPTWADCRFSTVLNAGAGQPQGVYTCAVTAPVVRQNQSYLLSLLVADADRAAVACRSNIVVQNTAPTCALFLAPSNPAPLSCEGVVTTVELSSVTPADVDGDALSSNYSISCAAGSGSVTTQSSSTVVASISAPSSGVPATCEVRGEVTDGFTSSPCAIAIELPACDLDCANVPNGSTVVDRCGVCGGNNACIDCAGTLFGTAAVDRCGICAGDGTSCLGCSEVRNDSAQLALDGSANGLAQLNKVGLRTLKRFLNNSRNARSFEARRRTQSQDAYLMSWRAVWSVPVSVTSCSNSLFCQTVAVAGADRLAEYDVGITRLTAIAAEITARMNAAGRKNAARNFAKDVKVVTDRIARERTAITTQSSVCS